MKTTDHPGVFSLPRSTLRLARRRRTSEWSAGWTSRRFGARKAAMATERASLLSLPFQRPVASTRMPRPRSRVRRGRPRPGRRAAGPTSSPTHRPTRWPRCASRTVRPKLTSCSTWRRVARTLMLDSRLQPRRWPPLCAMPCAVIITCMTTSLLVMEPRRALLLADCSCSNPLF